MIMFILFRKQHEADKDVSGSGIKDNMTGVTPDWESNVKCNATGKEKGTKTSSYCQKCEKFICKPRFEKFHMQSVL